jgi:hypothetical protein
MTVNEKLTVIAEKIAANKMAQDKVKMIFTEIEKVKPLTTEQRLDRIEQYLGIQK